MVFFTIFNNWERRQKDDDDDVFKSKNLKFQNEAFSRNYMGNMFRPSIIVYKMSQDKKKHRSQALRIDKVNISPYLKQHTRLCRKTQRYCKLRTTEIRKTMFTIYNSIFNSVCHCFIIIHFICITLTHYHCIYTFYEIWKTHFYAHQFRVRHQKKVLYKL